MVFGNQKRPQIVTIISISLVISENPLETLDRHNQKSGEYAVIIHEEIYKFYYTCFKS